MSEILLKYFNPKSIELAFHRVQCWTDKLVKDQVGIRAFKVDLEKNCQNLSEKIISGKYKAQRGFKFYVPKSSKTLRTKAVMFIEDAILYQAFADKLAQQHYDTLDQYNSFVFGSVLNVEVKKGVSILDEEKPNFFFFKFWQGLHNKYSNSIIQAIEVDKVKYKFETDITGFFDSIPHYNLLSKLSVEFGIEDEILDLLGDCLNIWSGTKVGPTPGVGIPQGCPPSFLLANFLLHQLDQQLVERGYRYYRYMDDISIYSYEEDELLDALLTIDIYTKSNALSINAKKTSVQEIIEGHEDSKVKELKKMRLFTSYEDTEDAEQFITLNTKKEKSNGPNIDKDLSKLSQQDNFNEEGNLLTISNSKEIAAYWLKQITDVENELPTLFVTLNNNALQIKESVDDIDAIRLSTAYGVALRELRYLELEVKPNKDLLKYWLHFYEKFFWRADKLGYTIMNYRYSKEVKDNMTKMLEGVFAKYEWGRYYIIQNLSLTQNFDEKELRQVYFQMLKIEDSDLVKISLYRLLYNHCKTEQFRSTLQNQLNKEKNQYLKVVIAEFNKFHNKENINLDEFLKSIGL
jgi:retron-type reverse transcriptase